MTDPVLAAASAVTQQASMIQAMRAEGERRVSAFRERMALMARDTGPTQPPCRQNLMRLGLPYPKSGCAKCGSILREGWRCAESHAGAATPIEVPAWDGYPPNRQDGAHWLREKRQWGTAEAPGPTFLAEWSEVSDRWFYFGVSGSEDSAGIARRCNYLGPCAQPAAPEADPLAGAIPCGTKVLWKSRRCFVVSHSFSSSPFPLWNHTLQDCFEQRLFSVVSPAPRPQEIGVVEWSEPAR